jgi:hypothetical protein
MPEIIPDPETIATEAHLFDHVDWPAFVFTRKHGGPFVVIARNETLARAYAPCCWSGAAFLGPHSGPIPPLSEVCPYFWRPFDPRKESNADYSRDMIAGYAARDAARRRHFDAAWRLGDVEEFGGAHCTATH